MAKSSLRECVVHVCEKASAKVPAPMVVRVPDGRWVRVIAAHDPDQERDVVVSERNEKHCSLCGKDLNDAQSAAYRSLGLLVDSHIEDNYLKGGS